MEGLASLLPQVNLASSEIEYKHFMMEFNFSYQRLALLGACLGVFLALGGFSGPETAEHEFVRPGRVQKAWFYCVVLFIGGAVSASVIDHNVGFMAPMNFRPFYIVTGVILMVAAVLWLWTLKKAIKDYATTTSRTLCAERWAV